jgi:hypothetical protein
LYLIARVMWTSGLVRQVFKAVDFISPVRYYEFS